MPNEGKVQKHSKFESKVENYSQKLIITELIGTLSMFTRYEDAPP
jgi:hypothetical protein